MLRSVLIFCYILLDPSPLHETDASSLFRTAPADSPKPQSVVLVAAGPLAVGLQSELVVCSSPAL